MDPRGYFCPILHAHLPYVRHPEEPEFLEEQWLFEALTESYLPLLLTLGGLLREGVDFRLSMSLTPTLITMLEDGLLRERYRRYLGRLEELAESEVVRQHFDAASREVAEFYRDRFAAVRACFEDRLGGDVLGGFRALLASGKVEFLASAATHAVLPLLRLNPASVRVQIRLGVETHRRAFGADPLGFWLPECAYYPGLDDLLKEAGVRYFILETHGLLEGSTRARYGAYAPISCPSGVAAFARDPDSSRQVWSAEEGYPSHPDYRDFFRDIGFDLPLDYIGRYIGPDELRIATGIKYHRITGRGAVQKEPYRREEALRRAAEHAGDFVRRKREQAARLGEGMDRRPIVVAPYDAELFGHWWFEGPEWLEQVLRGIASEKASLLTVTPSEYLAEYPEAQLSSPRMSSWGKGGAFQTWLNPDTQWIYPPLHQAGASMEDLAFRHRGAGGVRRRALDQAGRELLLAQASDWPFILHKGTATGYATRRLREHLERFEALARWGEEGALSAEDEKRLAQWEERDRIFPDLRFEAFQDGSAPRSWPVPREPRRVAFLAAEGVPYVKVGGLADVIGALPFALAESGMEVLVILPGYGSIDRTRYPVRPLLEGQAQLGARSERFHLGETSTRSPGVRALFVEHRGFFGREGIYTDPGSGAEYPDSTERFIFFTRAALEGLRLLGEPVDVVHCHDHQTALVPAYLKARFADDPVLGRAASVLTIHNLGYQGICPPEAFALSGLELDPVARAFEHHGRINFLKGAIELAGMINVVSEGYAREVRSDPAVGAGLEGVLAARGAALRGILNGIDVEEWDPATDPRLPRNYSAESLEGKRECKRALRERMGLAREREQAPLAGMITRLVDQKGLDLVCDGLERLLALDLDLVVLGTGLPKYQDYLATVARHHAGRIAVALKFDDALAHQIEAGADIFLMPSLYEPCGLNQMYSLRYGTVPVVRATGGLADTVTDDDAAPGAGNGFSFVPYRTDALVDAMARAARAFADRERWLGIMRRGMAADHSWGVSAERYRDLYRDALSANQISVARGERGASSPRA